MRGKCNKNEKVTEWWVGWIEKPRLEKCFNYYINSNYESCWGLELMLNKVFLIVGHLYRDLCGWYGERMKM